MFEGRIVRIAFSGFLSTITVDIGIELTAVITGKSAVELAHDTGMHVCISFKVKAVPVGPLQE